MTVLDCSVGSLEAKLPMMDDIRLGDIGPGNVAGL